MEKKSKTKKTTKPKTIKLLSGGNPQIAKADGDIAVQEFINAMPGWKKEVGILLDRLITKSVVDVRKVVKWNTPFYGTAGNGWFVAFHCISKYIKVAFPHGTALTPVPPVESKSEEVRYLHVYENKPFDEEQFVDWVKQAARQTDLPGQNWFDR